MQTEFKNSVIFGNVHHKFLAQTKGEVCGYEISENSGLRKILTRKKQKNVLIFDVTIRFAMQFEHVLAYPDIAFFSELTTEKKQ